jgi:hypothetical protein
VLAVSAGHLRHSLNGKGPDEDSGDNKPAGKHHQRAVPPAPAGMIRPHQATPNCIADLRSPPSPALVGFAVLKLTDGSKSRRLSGSDHFRSDSKHDDNVIDTDQNDRSASRQEWI